MSVIYILADKTDRLRDMDVRYLATYLDDGLVNYDTAEDAEEGRQRGDAYDEPGKTRVVGFKVTPFLPKKKKKGTRK